MVKSKFSNQLSKPAEGSGKETGIKPTKSAPKKSGLLGLVIAIFLVGTSLVVLVLNRHFENELGMSEGGVIRGSESRGQATIGGPFQLTDHHGKKVNERNFSGKYMLIHFGYTYCPDICPATLTEISNTLDNLGELAEQIIPIFITVDPERDTPEQLREYVYHFHPRLVGLTGSSQEIRAVTKLFRVYHSKIEPETSNRDPDDYLVDHSALVYFMGPNGEFARHFSHTSDAETMAKRIKETINP
tara:strand:+ start:82 stop:813 length:732 start_codon:yes stop_codon:yes gene_type:complete